MTLSEAFEKPQFVQRFEERREADDSINRLVDEPTIWSLLPALAGRTVLDVGCGLGHVAHRLAMAGASTILAVDPSKHMIERAKARFPHKAIQFHVGYVEELRRSQLFDVTISSMVLHFVPDLPALLRAVSNLLKPDGVFVFSQRHPVRTCNPGHSADPEDSHWPVTGYFNETLRDYTWLGEEVRLYHRTFDTIFDNLWTAGLTVEVIREPRPALVGQHASDRLKEAAEVPVELVCRCRKMSPRHEARAPSVLCSISRFLFRG